MPIPDQAAEVESIDSIVIAEFGPDGWLQRGNAGLRRITGGAAVAIWQLITRPLSDTFLNARPDGAGRVYSGLLTARGANEAMISLTGAIYRDGNRLRLVAGYDMNEFEAMAASLLGLNDKVNTAYRELARTNRKLEQREQEIRALSLTDALTGVGNRRHLDETLDVEIERSRCDGQPLSLIILDIDHFKRVNDTWGHEAGDRVLKEIAITLRATQRRTDIATRMGGEEFVVLLPATSTENAVACAERFRGAVEGRAFDLVGRITASFGVSSVRESETGASLLGRADAALYAAKQQGRNRVVAAPDP